ncbi:MAG TPA: hypothetical protein VL475_01070 [Planctomycetaceae bacterium]|nr:hypothetical protein [Planctomycetaceae bacterium]
MPKPFANDESTAVRTHPNHTKSDVTTHLASPYATGGSSSPAAN